MYIGQWDAVKCLIYKYYMVRGQYGTILSRGTDNESIIVSVSVPSDDSLGISTEG